MKSKYYAKMIYTHETVVKYDTAELRVALFWIHDDTTWVLYFGII